MEQPCGSNSLQISPPSVQLPARRSQHVAPSPQLPQWRLSRLKCPAQARQPSRSVACPVGAPTWLQFAPRRTLSRGCGGGVGEPAREASELPLLSWGRHVCYPVGEGSEALRGPCHTPITRAQSGARLEDNLSAPGPGCGFCPLGGCLQPVNEEQGRSPRGRVCGPRVKTGFDPAPARDSGQWSG